MYFESLFFIQGCFSFIMHYKSPQSAVGVLHMEPWLVPESVSYQSELKQLTGMRVSVESQTEQDTPCKQIYNTVHLLIKRLWVHVVAGLGWAWDVRVG